MHTPNYIHIQCLIKEGRFFVFIPNNFYVVALQTNAKHGKFSVV